MRLRKYSAQLLAALFVTMLVVGMAPLIAWGANGPSDNPQGSLQAGEAMSEDIGDSQQPDVTKQDLAQEGEERSSVLAMTLDAALRDLIGGSSQQLDAGKSLDGATVIVIPAEFRYDGTEKRPQVIVSLNGNDTTLVENRDYAVSYENNVSAGVAKAVVTGINAYSGKAERPFVIWPADSNMI